jgi:phosphatidylglycerol:prolipoprotein diacylglycerol transferase
MIVGIDPIVVSIGPVAVRWFGLLALAGLGLGIWLSLRGVSRQRLSRRVTLDALAWALPAGVLVARLVHVLGWWDYYFTHAAEIWQLNLDGLSLWGGLLGGLAIGGARLSRDPPRRRRIFDVLAPNVALGIAVGRLGAFLDGHGQGLPTDVPWATQYASRLAATPDFGVPRHPAQLYDALIALVVYGVLVALPRGLPAGSRIAMFFVLYGAARLALGAVRLDPSFLFGLQIEQLLAIGGIGFGAAYGLRPLLGMRRTRLAEAGGQPRPSEESVAA